MRRFIFPDKGSVKDPTARFIAECDRSKLHPSFSLLVDHDPRLVLLQFFDYEPHISKPTLGSNVQQLLARWHRLLEEKTEENKIFTSALALIADEDLPSGSALKLVAVDIEALCRRGDSFLFCAIWFEIFSYLTMSLSLPTEMDDRLKFESHKQRLAAQEGRRERIRGAIELIEELNGHWSFTYCDSDQIEEVLKDLKLCLHEAEEKIQILSGRAAVGVSDRMKILSDLPRFDDAARSLLANNLTTLISIGLELPKSKAREIVLTLDPLFTGVGDEALRKRLDRLNMQSPRHSLFKNTYGSVCSKFPKDFHTPVFDRIVAYVQK